MAANMLASYYGREVDSRSQFEHLRIREDASFERHLNQYHVNFLNMQEFLSTTHDIEKMILRIEKNLLKDKSYVTLAYMTGMLPIKKYGTHSALNMFDEFSHYTRSVVSAMLSRSFDSYWNQTETFEALRDYIAMNYAGLKDTVIELLAGEHKKIETGSFSNDMTTFSTADDVLTLLIHLGYFGYDFSSKEVFIPNSEIASEFVTAIQGAGWETVINAVKKSDDLLKAAWNKDAEAVAKGIKEAHFETSILKYNDENSLACVISLAFYSARTYYTEIRELPTGQGFADLVYLPRKNHQDKPGIIVELKWDKSAEGAIEQIKKKQYVKALEDYKGNLILVGVNYSKDSKVHQCIIEEVHPL